MEIVLEREIRSVTTTIGRLFIDGQYECFVLEDEDRGLKQTMPLAEIVERKIYGKTCIPEGRYRVIINQSNRFKRLLPLLLNVPGYEGIRIHPGNTEDNTEGCLLPGRVRRPDKVLESRLAFNQLFAKMQNAIAEGEQIFITIK
jgi:Family of unknown function (DUF5675)